MMKKITFLFILLTMSFGYSQVVLEDFEAPTPTVTEDNGLGSFNIIADPTGDGRGNVLEVVSAAAGDPWQQANLLFQDDDLDLSTDTTVSVDIYSTTSINILSRTEDPGVIGHSTAEAQHNGSGWETLVFDFTGNPDGGSAPGAGPYTQISFFPMWAGGASGNNTTNNNWFNSVDGNTFLVDTVTGVAAVPVPSCNDGIQNQDETGVDCGGVCAPCLTPPATAAPTPPARPAADVVSIYSDAYTGNIVFDNFDAGWCGGAGVTGVMLAGNNTLQKNAGIDCQGIDFNTDRQDLSGFTHIHFDFYTNDVDLVGDVFNVKLVDFGGGGAENSALEVNINTGTTPAIVAGSWVSVDVDITALGGVVANNLTRSDVAQIGITTTNLTNVWYDNIYLHKNTVLSTDDFKELSFKVYPNPTQDNWTVKSKNQKIETVEVYDMLGKQVMSFDVEATEIEIDGSSLKTGLYFARIKSEDSVNSIKLVKR